MWIISDSPHMDRYGAVNLGNRHKIPNHKIPNNVVSNHIFPNNKTPNNKIPNVTKFLTKQNS